MKNIGAASAMSAVECVARMRAEIAAIRRERQMAEYRRDSLVLQVGREIERERVRLLGHWKGLDDE